MALPKKPQIETMNVTEARRQFSETLNRVHRGEAHVLVKRSGITVGAIVSPEDYAAFRRMEDRRAGQWAAVDRLRASFAGVADDELDAEIEKASRLKPETSTPNERY